MVVTLLQRGLRAFLRWWWRDVVDARRPHIELNDERRRLLSRASGDYNGSDR